MEDLEINIMQKENDFAAIQLSGRLDSTSAKRLEDIAFALYEKGCRQIVLSCELLSYINSAGLQILLGIARKLTVQTGKSGLSLCAVNNKIKGILEMSGLLNCISVYDDVMQARHDLSKEAH